MCVGECHRVWHDGLRGLRVVTFLLLRSDLALCIAWPGRSWFPVCPDDHHLIRAACPFILSSNNILALLSRRNSTRDSRQSVGFRSGDNRTGLAAFCFNGHQDKAIESLAVVRRKNVEIGGIAVAGSDNFAGAVDKLERHTSIWVANNIGNAGGIRTGQLIIDPEEIKIHETTGRLCCVIE